MTASYRSARKTTTKASSTRTTFKAYLLWDDKSFELVTVVGVI
jgi:hypothetical protein